jgi:hypothetical protein
VQKLAGYTFKVEWIAGKKHEIADALSRSPVFDPEEDEDIIKLSSVFVSKLDDTNCTSLDIFLLNKLS